MKRISMYCSLLMASNLVYAQNILHCDYNTIKWCPQENACRIKSIGHQANRVQVTSKDVSQSVICLLDYDVTEPVNGYVVFFEDGSDYIEADKKHPTTPTYADFERLNRMETDDE